MLPNTSQSRTGRRLLKRVLYSLLALVDVFMIPLGKSQPRARFTVKASPNSMYFNFKVKDDQREAFIRYINLPAGFTVCPIRCIEGEQADFILTLNVYEVGGIAVGMRAEWSTYIMDDAGVPRYMVLEAQSSAYGLEATDVITKKGLVEHSTSAGEGVTTVASLLQQRFHAKYSLPSDAPLGVIHREWVTANDYIYWRNGICDHILYDAGMANPKMRLLSTTDAVIDDQTHWAQFIEPVPKHIVQYEEAIDLVLVPWVNI
jgi:hypothetical protein